MLRQAPIFYLMKKYPVLFVFILFVCHFVVSVVLGTMLGIYTYIASFAALFAICVCYGYNADRERAGAGFRRTLACAVSFAGVLIVGVSLRFITEVAFPDLSVKLNILFATKPEAGMQRAVYMIVSSLAVTSVSVFLANKAPAKPRLVRYLCAAVLGSLFALDFSMFLGNMLLGAFLLYLYDRGISAQYIFVLGLIFKVVSVWLDFVCSVLHTSFGAEMGFSEAGAMLVLFSGIAMILFAVGDIFISGRVKKILTYTLSAAGLLLTVIGCATVQYFNM